jgi:chromosome segregation ATPase
MESPILSPVSEGFSRNFKAAGIPRARESGSHEDSTLSTVRRFSNQSVSTVDKCSVDSSFRQQTDDLQGHADDLQNQVHDLQSQVERLQQSIIDLQHTVKGLTRDVEMRDQSNSQLTEIIQSLESQIEKMITIEELRSSDEAEKRQHDFEKIQALEASIEFLESQSEMYRQDIEQRKSVMWTFAELSRNLRISLEADHAKKVELLQAEIKAKEIDLIHISRQCMRCQQHNAGLCQLVDSMSIYVSGLEDRFHDISRRKSDEIEALQMQNDNLTQIICKRDARIHLLMTGTMRASAFLAELAEKDC